MTVLLVENQWLITAPLSACLTDAGFEVIEVTRAESALSILRDRAETICAVVTAMRLAGYMHGIALVEEAARCWPWLMLLIVTGEAAERLAARPPSCGLVSKPCLPETVLAELQTMIERRTPKGGAAMLAE